MCTSILLTFYLSRTDNCNFLLSSHPCPPPLSLIIPSLSPLASFILTLSLSPLLFWNLVSMRMLNLGRNDTCGRCMRQKKRKKKLHFWTESRHWMQSGCRLDPVRWELLYSCPVNDVWEYLQSTLQHHGVRRGRGRNSICYSHMPERTIISHTADIPYHKGICAYITLNIWWHLENQLVKVNIHCIMHWGDSKLVYNTNRGSKTHTCDGVGVKVPGLFCHIEESRY